MPEMPEVEVTRRGIDEPLRGARVLALRLGKPLRWPLGCPAEALVGSTVGPVSRRGKYLWLPLAGAGGLLMHLGMSGSLALGDGGLPAGPHDHFDLVTSHGTLRLTDPRRFGAVVWSPALDSGAAARLLAPLGHEPFDEALTPALFHAGLRRRRTAVKTVLLEGSLIVGAGNIYACEALFRAGIDPRTRAERISRPRAERLLVALRATLARALDVGGSTLRDFRDVHGLSGAFQAEAGVYGRAGLPCGRCGGSVRRIVQSQRSTFLCPVCQTR
jgi:formamidopyrimidine-DNA glycosylase